MTTSSSGNWSASAGRPAGSPADSDGQAVREVWLTIEEELPFVGRLQAAALDVYGRLEPERALVWTLEELGELAQAVRRREGRARLEEELGQLTVWMFCLANILDVDLAAAVEAAIREEIERQLAKYGALNPYRAGAADQ